MRAPRNARRAKVLAAHQRRQQARARRDEALRQQRERTSARAPAGLDAQPDGREIRMRANAYAALVKERNLGRPSPTINPRGVRGATGADRDVFGLEAAGSHAPKHRQARQRSNPHGTVADVYGIGSSGEPAHNGKASRRAGLHTVRSPAAHAAVRAVVCCGGHESSLHDTTWVLLQPGRGHADQWGGDDAHGGNYAAGMRDDDDVDSAQVTSEMIKRVRQRFGPVDRRLAVTIAGHMNARSREQDLEYVHESRLAYDAYEV